MLGLRSRTFIPVLLVASLLVTLSGIQPASATLDRENRMHRMVQDARKSSGLRSLYLSQRLSDVARAHSRQMRGGRRMYHHSCLRCTLSSYSYRIAGENVGYGSSVRAVFRMLMRSKSHRANILRSGFKRIGIGAVRGGGRVWVTQIFLG